MFIKFNYIIKELDFILILGKFISSVLYKVFTPWIVIQVYFFVATHRFANLSLVRNSATSNEFGL